MTTATAEKIVEEKKGLSILRATVVREKAPPSMRVTTEFIDALEEHVAQLLADAIAACKDDGRNTLKGRDVFMASRKKLDQLKNLVENALNGV